MNNDTSSKNNTNNNVEQLTPTQNTTTNQTATAKPTVQTVSKPVTPTAQPAQAVKPQNVQNNPNQAKPVQQTQPVSPQKPLTKKEAKRLAKEKAKQLKREKSNFRYIMTIILFILLFVFVFYLPDISHYLNEKQYLKNKEGLITTGDLYCKKKDNDDNFNYLYENTFSFANNKLTRLDNKVTTTGSLSKDLEHLEELKKNCDNLKLQTKGLDGVNIRCSLNDKTTIVEQELRYVDIKVEKVTNSYIEAGGVYPNYKYKDNINKIEKEMKSAGYTCERTQ